MELSPKAALTLLKANRDFTGTNGRKFYTIKRTLGYRTWASCGRTGARADVAELYRKGLIVELAHPWSGECILTDEGEAVLATLQSAE